MKCEICKDTGYKGIFHPRTLELSIVKCDCKKDKKIIVYKHQSCGITEIEIIGEIYKMGRGGKING